MSRQVVDFECRKDERKYREHALCWAVFTAFRQSRNSRSVSAHGVRSLSSRALSRASLASLTASSYSHGCGLWRSLTCLIGMCRSSIGSHTALQADHFSSVLAARYSADQSARSRSRHSASGLSCRAERTVIVAGGCLAFTPLTETVTRSWSLMLHAVTRGLVVRSG